MRRVLNQGASIKKLTLLGVGALSLLLSVTVFSPSFQSLHARWTDVNDSYSHGYLILLMAAFMLYTKVAEIDFSPKPTWLPLPCLLLLSVVWLAGYATQTQLLEQVVIPVMIWFYLAAVIGWYGAVRLSAPILLLFLAIPVWDFLISPLRYATIFVVQEGLQVLAIPALIDGFNIHLTAGILIVAGGCAGLNFLLVGMVIGSYYAYTVYHGWRYRAVAFFLAVLIGLVGNWVRVFLLVLVGHYSQMQSPLVYQHGGFGWLLFGVFIVIYFLLLRLLIEPAAESKATMDRTEESICWPYKSMFTLATLAVVVVLLLPAWARWCMTDELAPRGSVYKNIDSSLFYQAREGDPLWRAGFAGYDHVEERLATLNNRQYQLVALSYFQQAQGKELIYFSNRLAVEGLVKYFPPLSLGSDYSFNQAIVSTPEGKRMVWWLYSVGGRQTRSDLVAKFLQLPALLRASPSASLITLSARCSSFSCVEELQYLSADYQHRQLLLELSNSL